MPVISITDRFIDTISKGAVPLKIAVFCIAGSFAYTAENTSQVGQPRFGPHRIEILAKASTLEFRAADDPEVPGMESDNLTLNLKNREVAIQELTRHAEHKVAKLKDLYGLEAKQTEKLMIAAQYDIERFFHLIDMHRVQADQANSPKVRLNTEFFGNASMLAKTLTNTATEAQKGQRLRNLHELRIQWLKDASENDLLNWIARKAKLSTGQLARIQYILRLQTTSHSARKTLEQLSSINRQELDAILTEAQMLQVFDLLVSFEAQVHWKREIAITAP